MELDSTALAILSLIFVVVFRLIWNLLGGIDDAFDEFWKEIKRKGTDLEDDEDDRTQSGKK